MDQDTQLQIKELLAQLRDVHVSPADWWPPAPGWWLLALLFAVLCVYGLLRQQRKHQRFAWVVLAETELAELEAQFERADISAQRTVSQLSVLMRRSAMAAKGRKSVARATDEEWIKLISAVGNGRGFGRSAAELLVQAPYRSTALPDEQVLDLLKSCREWLQGARMSRGVADV